MTFAPAAKREASPGKRDAAPAASAPASDSPRYLQALMGPGGAGEAGATVSDAPGDGASADRFGGPRYVQALTGAPPPPPASGPRRAIQRSRDRAGLAAPSPAAVHAATHDRSAGRPLATAVAGGLATASAPTPTRPSARPTPRRDRRTPLTRSRPPARARRWPARPTAICRPGSPPSSAWC